MSANPSTPEVTRALKPCPFCGGEASLTIPSEHVTADCADIYVSCDECEAEGQRFVVEMRDRTPDLWPYERRDAIAAWNTRTPARGGDELREAAQAAQRQFDFYAREHRAAGKAEKAATNQRFSDLLETALASTDMAGAGEGPKGTFACPICGQDTPHHHTPTVVDAYQNKGTRT